MAIVEGQMVEVRWGSKNKAYYTKLGYKFTKMFDEFNVKAEELTEYNREKIQIYCDDCNEVYEARNDIYNHQIKTSSPHYCNKCRYINLVKNVRENAKNHNKLQTYKDILSGRLKIFPQSFFTDITMEEGKVLVEHLVSILTETGELTSRKEIPKVLTQNIFKKYKLTRLQHKFGLVNLVTYCFEGEFLPWEFNRKPDEFWNNEENVKWAIDWFVEKLIEDGIINSFEELNKIKGFKTILPKYGLGSLMSYYGGSFSKILLTAYPETYKEWNLPVHKNFYKNELNKNKVLEWFFAQIKIDGIIETHEDIPRVVNRELFEQYGLLSFITHCFDLSLYKTVDYYYPDKWKIWEIQRVPPEFWKDPVNIRDCYEWLIEKMKQEGLIKEVSDINAINLKEVFEGYHLTTLYRMYDVIFMLGFLYPKEVLYETKNIAKDGVKLLSFPEKLIHNFLIENFSLVYRPTQSADDKFFNEDQDESYIPDWIVDNNIIIEYFGLQNSRENDYAEVYRSKTFRKIKYYDTLDNYHNISLYPQDIENNLQGAKEKLAPYIKKLQEV